MRYYCPNCSQALECAEELVGKKASCPKCGQKTIIPSPPKQLPAASNKTTLGTFAPGTEESVEPAPARPFIPEAKFADPEPPLPTEPRREVADVAPRKHSALGIAAFLIVLLVGGMDVVLMLIIAISLATSGDGVKAGALGGVASLYCLNCMSIPLCVVGIGLVVVGLTTNRDCNHVYTWIGLIGNSVVVVVVVAAYALMVILGGIAQGRENRRIPMQ